MNNSVLHQNVQENPLVTNLSPFSPRSGEDGLELCHLGIDTKTSSSPLLSTTYKPSFFRPDTGEGVYFEEVVTSQTRRSTRWAYKSVVNKLMPRSRTSQCMNFRHAVQNASGDLSTSNIEIKKTKEGKAHFSGLMQCGSIWNCPICAAKVSEKRRQELKLGLELAKNHSYSMKAHLVTLTVRHYQGDNLRSLRLNLRKAMSKMSSGRDAISQQLAGFYYGFIRCLEVTHGKENGFHPHYHIIVFTDKSIESTFLCELYTNLWIKSCVASGLPAPDRIHGCTVKDGSFADEYISKWGLEDEMTKANTKVCTNKKGVTPFGLLKIILDDEKDEYYNVTRASLLFKLYVKAFKGARQLYWSNGLKKLLGLNDIDISDEDLVKEQIDEDTYSLGSLSFEQWQIIRKKHLESSVLDIAENYNLEYLQTFIINLTGTGLIGCIFNNHDEFLLENANKKLPPNIIKNYWTK